MELLQRLKRIRENVDMAEAECDKLREQKADLLAALKELVADVESLNNSPYCQDWTELRYAKEAIAKAETA